MEEAWAREHMAQLALAENRQQQEQATTISKDFIERPRQAAQEPCKTCTTRLLAKKSSDVKAGQLRENLQKLENG